MDGTVPARVPRSTRHHDEGGAIMDGRIADVDANELPVALDAMANAAGVGWWNLPADTPIGLRVWVLLNWLEYECLNGGLEQYLYNKGDEHADEIRVHLQRIGATKAAVAFPKAIAAYRRWSAIDDADVYELGDILDESGALAEWSGAFDEFTECLYEWLDENRSSFSRDE